MMKKVIGLLLTCLFAGVVWPCMAQVDISGSGPDMQVKYRMQVMTGSDKQVQLEMQMNMFYAKDPGLSRIETLMQNPLIGDIKMVVLGDLKKPERTTLLDEKNKQYAYVDLSKSQDSKTGETYSTRVLGEEQVGGLNCTRVEVSDSQGGKFEFWVSRDIEGYEALMSLYEALQQSRDNGMWQALKEAGVNGGIVRLKTRQMGADTVMDLVSLKRDTLPQSLFLIPEGYTEAEEGLLPGMP